MGRSAYSDDLRERVVLEIGEGVSRREAARRFRMSASSAIRWAERHDETGSVSPKPRGGHRRSPLEPTQERVCSLTYAAACVATEIATKQLSTIRDRDGRATIDIQPLRLPSRGVNC